MDYKKLVLTVSEWLDEEPKSNTRLSLMLNAEVIDDGVYKCPVDDWGVPDKWAKVKDAGKEYVIVKVDNKIHIKIL